MEFRLTRSSFLYAVRNLNNLFYNCLHRIREGSYHLGRKDTLVTHVQQCHPEMLEDGKLSLTKVYRIVFVSKVFDDVPGRSVSYVVDNWKNWFAKNAMNVDENKMN